MTVVIEVLTRHGPARWHIDQPRGPVRALLVLGHGAGRGVDSPDLALVAAALVPVGVRVARFEQPWCVAGRRIAGPPAQLDAAWNDAIPTVLDASLPLIAGGRSAGARVACRTAATWGAAGVLALAFPLHPRGKPDVSRASELPEGPVLVVQGDRDSLGGADELRNAGRPLSRLTVLCVPGADHSLRSSSTGPITQREADEIVALGVLRWIIAVVRGNHP